MTRKNTTDDANLTRRGFLATATAAAAAYATFGSAAGQLDGGRSPLVRAGDWPLQLRWDVPDDAVIMREGWPSWIIETDEDRSDALEEWRDREDEFSIVREAHVDDWHAALVASPAGVIQSLANQSWVQSVDLDIDVDLIEPVVPTSAGGLGLADLSRRESFSFRFEGLLGEAASMGDLDTGVAYRDDMEPADLDDVRDIVNALATADAETIDLTAVVIDTGVTADSIFEDAEEETRILDASTDFTDSDRPTVGEQGLDTVRDRQGHGNWVAAAMAGDGNTTGYAPTADILALKALDDDGSGSAFDIAEAIRYAADEVGDDGVACLSLGSPIYSYTLDQAVAYAAGAGMPCVVAAGNDRDVSRWVNSPADSPEAITVTATTAEDADEARSAAFHNTDPDSGSRNFSAGYTQGSHIDLTAPGCAIDVETPTGMQRLTGTSMAAPQVAGGIMQLLAEDSSPQGDIDELRERLTEYAQPVPKAGVTEAGAGMLDIQAAIDEDEPDETQAQARDDDAQARDLAHEQLSNGEGGFLFGLL